MNKINEVLNALKQDAKSKEIAYKLINVAFELVNLLHRQSQGEEIPKSEVDDRVKRFEEARSQAEKLNSGLKQVLSQSPKKAAIDIVEANVMK